MAENNTVGRGTRDDPWQLKTPSGSSEYTLYRDEKSEPPTLVCTVGKTVLLHESNTRQEVTACGRYSYKGFSSSVSGRPKRMTREAFLKVITSLII
jgi:hypothetical protein